MTRSVHGIASLREIAKIYGPVEITYAGRDGDYPWTVRLSGKFNHEHGTSLEKAASALLEQLERIGIQP